jgi:hypothetical protein
MRGSARVGRVLFNPPSRRERRVKENPPYEGPARRNRLSLAVDATIQQVARMSAERYAGTRGNGPRMSHRSSRLRLLFLYRLSDRSCPVWHGSPLAKWHPRSQRARNRRPPCPYGVRIPCVRRHSSGPSRHSAGRPRYPLRGRGKSTDAINLKADGDRGRYVKP